MSVFKNGERVRIIEDNESKIYKIKKIKKIRSGGILYLLKSLEENSVMRLYYENRKLLLERIG
jgi:hypothetical protein